MYKPKTSAETGFSLIELMIVVGIIGILATLAIPRFSEFQAKARMAEARNTLQHIYTLEQTYHLDNGSYRNVAGLGAVRTSSDAEPVAGCANAAIGLSIQPCNNLVPRYQYSVGGASATAFVARAVSGFGEANRICTSSKGSHAFYIDQTRNLVFAHGDGSYSAMPSSPSSPSCK